MKKSMLALAITALASTAWAQVSPAPMSPVAPLATTPAPQVLPPLPTGANPFTGVTKAQTEIERSENDLKRLRALSAQKLSLQRDELDALRIELDKKKILDALNPPKPVEVKVVPTGPVTPVSNAPGASLSSSGKTTAPKVIAKAEPVQKPAPTPPQIIAPAATKFEAPQVLGVIDIAGQKVAMVKFDGQTFRVMNGSTVGGKPVASIEPSGVQWGNSFLSVASATSIPPTMAMTDDRSDPKNRAISAPISAAPQAPQPVMAQPYMGPSSPVTISPVGATRSTNGAAGPTGVLQLPPPPPSLVR